MASRIQLVLQIDQGNLDGMRELASTDVVYIAVRDCQKSCPGTWYCAGQLFITKYSGQHADHVLVKDFIRIPVRSGRRSGLFSCKPH